MVRTTYVLNVRILAAPPPDPEDDPEDQPDPEPDEPGLDEPGLDEPEEPASNDAGPKPAATDRLTRTDVLWGRGYGTMAGR
jgi:hypothetical protein